MGLVAALMAAILPITSYAAATAPKPPRSRDSIKKGMAAAPGVITQAGLDCNLANARMMGKATDAEDQGREHLLRDRLQAGGGLHRGCARQGRRRAGLHLPRSPQHADLRQPSVHAAGQRRPEAGSDRALVAKYKPGVLRVTDARGIGQTADRTATVFEVACQGGPGYNMQASFPLSRRPKPATFNPCFAIRRDSPEKCTLTDAATPAAYVDSLAAKMGKPCMVPTERYVWRHQRRRQLLRSRL